MVGENFESFLPQMAKIAFKLSTMVGENIESFLPQMAEIAFKLFTMVGENFGSPLSTLSAEGYNYGSPSRLPCGV